MPNQQMRRLAGALLFGGVLCVVAAGAAWRGGLFGALRGKARTLYERLTVEEGCVAGLHGISVCVASDMAKLSNHGVVPLERWLFSPRRRLINLDAARNEVVAFQLIFKGRGVSPARRVSVEVSDLRGPGSEVLRARPGISRYLAHYVWVEPGGYSWGPPSRVLPWPDFYPDALIPFRARCGLPSDVAAAAREAVNTFAVPPAQGHNQAVWIDIHVPRDLPAGLYSGQVLVQSHGQQARLALRLRVHPATIPDRVTVAAISELYDSYEAEGVGRDISSRAWQRMAQCYQQLAHRHRAVFIERLSEAQALGESDTHQGWIHYGEAFGPALTGALFTAEYGYLGPGQGVPVSSWRTPWDQPYNGRLQGPLSPEQLRTYEQRARRFADLRRQQGWTYPRLFAYLFDEVEGGTDKEASRGQGAAPEEQAYIVMAHQQMRQVQQALDRGAGAQTIDLLWTSHQDPSVWAGQQDLRGIIRLWCPSAHAADPQFLKGRAAAGEQVWFYHDGHPSLGVHSINASGVELRTWGVITARYGLHGHFIWAGNLGDPENPYGKPSYKNGDDRFGNGTLVYPGAQLPQIGFPVLREPIPSMRLKAWRRGLQDAELAQLARQAGARKETARLLKELIPRALAEGEGGPAWPSDSGSWNRFRRQLLKLASRKGGAPQPRE